MRTRLTNAGKVASGSLYKSLEYVVEKSGDTIGIPGSRVHTTGSNKAKVEQIKSLNIGTHYDNNKDVIDQLGETSTNGVKF